VVDEAVIVEIVRPGSGDPVPAGEVGEVVVTAFNPDYPLVRFATGDLSAALPGGSGCGRTNMRLKGWLGRADQATKVRGMFVHPRQVDEAVRRVGAAGAALGRARLVVRAGAAGGRDEMRLWCEAPVGSPDLAHGLAEAMRATTGLRAEVEIVPPGSLPDDGKVIDDQRRPAAAATPP
jgi:phenylacetate-CoA ligase